MARLSRMRIVLLAIICISLALAQGIPITGNAVPGLEVFDSAMTQVMNNSKIPGAALAVVRDGRLVFARGYGYADTEARTPVQPDSLFRLASISKPHTAAAVLKLIEQGKLSLNAKAFDILSSLKPPPGAQPDPRLHDITILHLLEHTGGWDPESTGYDPVFDVVHAAEVVGATPPADCETLIRYMLGRPLDFAPGTKSAYSNFGYCVLERVIEQVTGQTYESYLHTNVLWPLGSYRTAVGSVFASNRIPGEVKYYDSSFPAYGFPLDPGCCGLVSNTIELLKYLTSINGTTQPAILKSPPAGFVFYVPPVGRFWGWRFDGSLNGNQGTLRLDDRTAWCVLTNTRSYTATNFLAASTMPS